MLEKHLDFLRCPVTREPLSLVANKCGKDGHIESGDLISSANTYPIVDGIPRFVFSQSRSEKQTVKAFGDQWNEADETTLYYGQNEDYFSVYLQPLHPNEFENSVVLDAGCGNGRLVEYSLKFNPKLIVGIDYSRSAELAFKRTRHCQNVLIVQASLLSPPLIPQGFDIIYSLGVIHHLERPEKGLLELGKLLEKNGKIHIWTYSREGNEIYLALVTPVRWVAKKLPNKALWFLSSLLGGITWPYLWLCAFLADRFTKNYLPMQSYMFFMYKFGFKIYKVAIHDQLAPSIVFYPSRDNICSWAQDANLQIFHMDMRTNNSWRVGLKKIGIG